MTAPRMPEWSRAGRPADLDHLSEGRWDLLVIGGGITGAGVALDAASRGQRVVLVEKNDFASGTSSKSSKLIHGGLRYLKEFQFRTTFEASREKHRLKKLAPHLVQDLPFLFPILRHPAQGLLLGTGLWIYDLAAGLPQGMIHRKLDAAEMSRRLPGLRQDRYEGGFQYFDARADDCRLTLHVLKRAVSLGAVALNYTALDGFLYGREKIRGARVRDAVTGATFTLSARAIVNATGVWCDEIRHKDEPQAAPLVRPSKGVHLVVPRERIGNETAVVIPSPQDQRIIFLIPWERHTIIGTTDTDYTGDPLRPRVDDRDVQYLLALVNEALPDVNLTPADLCSTYAGLRPLLLSGDAHPSRASREHYFTCSTTGLYTITGGKLTTYRLMAKQVVDRILEDNGERVRSQTERTDLFAAPPSEDPLVCAYGTEAEAVRRLLREDPSLDEPLAEGSPHRLAEAVYALQSERAVHLSDILSRRTRAILFADGQARAVADRLARRLLPYTGWDPAEEVARYEEELSLHAK